MQAYRKERIENAMFFFAHEHYQSTRKYLLQTSLYKYLALFEFRYLKATGEMPLGLTYRAMEHGPVPLEIYENRAKQGYYSLVTFESVETGGKSVGYVVKPCGKFNADYFADTELEEMHNLIEIFARRWVGTSVMSDASHQAIRSWRLTHSRSPNAVIDPIEEFERDILNVSADELTPQEERYLFQRSIQEYCPC
jgi:hypothetical protein